LVVAVAAVVVRLEQCHKVLPQKAVVQVEHQAETMQVILELLTQVAAVVVEVISLALLTVELVVLE
jgi:hypothetical protein